MIHSKGKSILKDNRDWEKDKPRIETLSLKLSIERQPIFRAAAERIVRENGLVNRKDLLDSCCSESGSLQKAGAGYLDTMAAKYSNKAIFDYVKGRDLKKLFPDLEGLEDDEYYVRLRNKKETP